MANKIRKQETPTQGTWRQDFNSSASPDDYSKLSQRGVARFLNVSVSTVQRLRKNPEFPARKMFANSSKGWLKHEIKAWADSRPVG